MIDFTKITTVADACHKAMQGLKPEERAAVLALLMREDGKPGRKRGGKGQETMLTESERRNAGVGEDAKL